MTEKSNIENLLNSNRLDEARIALDAYTEKFPKDMDVICMNCLYYIYSGDFETALVYALDGIEKYPTSGDMYYNAAYIYEQQGDLLNSAENYCKAFYILQITDPDKSIELHLSEKADEQITLVTQLSEQLIASADQTNLQSLKNIYAFMERSETYFGLSDNVFRNKEISVGKYHYSYDGQKRYAGIHKDFWYNEETDMNLVQIKANMLEVTEGDSYKVSSNDTYLLPIAAENPNTVHRIQTPDGRHDVIQLQNRHFSYYRICGDASVISSGKSYYGNPILLRQDLSKHKLVLNIFVDGLVGSMLHGDDFKKSMPYTYAFFSKGTICENAYNVSEWTYPSIANIVSGLDTTEHMLFHPDINCALPMKYPTLPEYYHDAGYYTASLCGNWRIIPTYGHARGYDQYVYQHQWIGCKAEMVAGDVIDQIEAFKETNQFLWVTYGDLHDIADGLGLPISVQKDIPINMRAIEDVGSTSAKQEYSEQKINEYLLQLKRLDRHLHTLFSYLEENFSDDEILVSLFSDHGQGYVIPPDRHFLDIGRSNVGFMFRGKNVPQGICREIISTSDYMRIMCKLADIPLKEGCEKGNLPVWFGGSTKREYTLTESIHPKDPYYCAIYAENEICFFTNPNPAGGDGRFRLSDNFKIWLEDYNGNPIENQALKDKYQNIILEHIASVIIYD